MSTKVYNGLDLNSTRIENLGAPVSANDAVRLADLNSAVEGIAWKDSVRVSTQGNVNLASPGATIDGVTMAAGDRFLARSQSTAAENGIYVWNGAATPATRAPDANTAAELEAAVVTVEEGTNAGASYRQTSVNFTIDSGAVAWTLFGTSAGAASETSAGIAEIATQAETDTGTDDARIVTPLKLKTSTHVPKRFQSNFGDGSATQFDFTHNFGTRDCVVQVYRNGSPWDQVMCDVEALSANVTRLRFTSGAPTANQFRVVIVA